MTSSAFHRPAFIVDVLYELAVDAPAPLFKLRSTRTPAGMTAQTRSPLPGGCATPSMATLMSPSVSRCAQYCLRAPTMIHSPGDALHRGRAGDAALYVSQSEPVIKHLVATSRAGQTLPFELIGRAVGHDRLEIIEFTCEHS